MPKQLDIDEYNLKLKELSANSQLESVESCNKLNCVTKDTKLIIVGTITPPEGAGYFYTAPRNKIYGYLDQTFGDTNLKEKKGLLLQNHNDNQIIEDIKNILISKKVAFLDVIKYAIRKKNSPYDNDIKFYTLDIEVFKKNTKAKFICNSIFARDCFLQICEKLNTKMDYIYLSQRKDTKLSWINEIKSILF